MKAVQDSLHNLFVSLARYPLILLSSIVVTRLLGPDNKGIYVYLIMITNIILPLSFLGLGNGIQYYISRRSFTPKDSVFSFGVAGLGTGIFVAALIFLLWRFGLLGETGAEVPELILYIFLLGAPIDGILYALRFVLTGDSRFKLYNNIYLGISLLTSLALLVIVYLAPDKLLGAALVLNSVKVVNLLVVFYYVQRAYAPSIRLHWQSVKAAYKYGIKSWLGNISARANDQLDQLIIGMFIAPAQLGIYSVSYALVNLLLIPSNAISPVLFNQISRVKSIDASSKLVAQIHRSLFLLMLIFALSLGVAAYWLIPFMYGSEFQEAYLPFLILLPGMLLYSITRRVLQKFLAANGFPLKTSLVQFVGALSGVISYIILIPRYGIVGGAIGSTIAYTASTFTAFYIARNMVQGEFNFFAFSWRDIRWGYDKIIAAVPAKWRQKIRGYGS